MPDELKKMLESVRVKQIPKGQIILYEGDSPLEVYMLKSGIVKLYSIDDQGNEKILHLVGPSGIIPFSFFSGGDRATSWFYTALIDCDVYVLSKDKLQQLMEAQVEVAMYLMHWFSDEVHELLVRLESLGKTNVHDKLCAALKFLSVCHTRRRRSGWLRVTFPISHQLLADMIGMTRERTAMAMKELADEKIIRNPRLTILEINYDKLVN